MLIRQSLLYILARGATGALTFLVIALYTRLLTPAEYGFYTLVVATEALGFTLSLLSLCSATLRLLPAASDENEFHSAIVALYLAMATALAAIFLGALPLLPSVDRSACGWALALLLAHGWLEINLHLQQARLQAGRYVVANVARSSIAGGVGVSLVWAGCGVPGALTGYLLGLLVPAGFLSVKELRRVRLGMPKLHTLRTLLAFGAPLSLAYALDNVVYYSDRLVIAFFAGADAVGRYAAGFDLADKSVHMVMLAVGTAGFALALRLYENGERDRLRQQLERNATLLLAIGVPATVGLIMVAPDLAQLLGGEFRASAATIIPIIAVTIFLGCLRGSYFDHSFHLSRRPGRLACIVGVTAVANLALNLVLVPRFGLIGAAWASLASFAGTLAMSVLVGRRAFAMPFPLGGSMKIAAAAAAMALALHALPPVPVEFSLVLRVAAGGSVYALCALLLNIGRARDALAGRVLPRLRSRLLVP